MARFLLLSSLRWSGKGIGRERSGFGKGQVRDGRYNLNIGNNQ